MKWLIFIGVAVTLLGPLRRWVGRHWAFLLSTIAGAALGFVLGAWVLALGGGGSSAAALPLLWGLVGAIAVGRAGPAWLRHMEKDGKDGRSSGRH